jgi:hypothetical protein
MARLAPSRTDVFRQEATHARNARAPTVDIDVGKNVSKVPILENNQVKSIYYQG